MATSSPTTMGDGPADAWERLTTALIRFQMSVRRHSSRMARGVRLNMPQKVPRAWTEISTQRMMYATALEPVQERPTPAMNQRTHAFRAIPLQALDARQTIPPGTPCSDNQLNTYNDTCNGAGSCSGTQCIPRTINFQGTSPISPLEA